MWVIFKKIFPLLLCVSSIGFQEVSSTGWKPIPPPPGLYISKTSFPLRGALTEHLPVEDFRQEHKPEGGLQDRKHQIYEIFSPSEEFIYPKDIKLFKSPPPIYESVRKRPTISYTSFNTFPLKKPGIYYEKPGLIYVKPPPKKSYLDEYKFHKGFSDNEIGSYYPSKGHDDHCPLHKVSFRQDLYFQYIQYKVHMPDLKEFTICMWSKFHNHSYDQPLFSYAVRHQPKAIYMWVSHTERSNYYNMKINGHPIFRLNYPIRLNRWYHTCQSWNSKTGEWQVWVNSKRIGRGFHNLLVGHVIPGGGIAISGQEQLQYGGGFLEASDFPKGSGGLLGELTMVQLYRIALSAGKAYTDHRHHHSHYTSTTPEPPEIPTEEPLPTPEHPFLENGQLKKPLKVFELAESLRTKGNTENSQPTFTDFFEGQFVNPYLATDHAYEIIPHTIFKRQESDNVKFSTGLGGIQVEKINFDEDEDWSHRTRRSVNETDYDGERNGRGMIYVRKRRVPGRKRLVIPVHLRTKESEEEETRPKKIVKKQVILGDVRFRPFITHDFGYLAVPTREKEKEPDDNPLHTSSEDSSPPQPEPAEEEVGRIMSVCSGCERDPYRKGAFRMQEILKKRKPEPPEKSMVRDGKTFTRKKHRNDTCYPVKCEPE